MSSSIWTECADGCSPSSFGAEPWRIVEAQHQISTRKLVDSIDEQVLLEELIETSKPPPRVPARLHVLLSTPFRYPPLRHGSRFAARHEPALWYGSEGAGALFAELAYYRFVFLDGTRADLDLVTTWHTAFRVKVRTERGVDLTRPPFGAHRAAISAPASYDASQALGSDMRGAGVEAFRYFSARDPAGGTNVGVVAPAAFGAARPRDFQTWHCSATRDRVEVVRRDFLAASAHVFTRTQFLVEGKLPAPAV
jgi:hypothetical protein